MKKRGSGLSLYIKVFLIMVVLGVIIPKILQIASYFFSNNDGRPCKGNCVYVMFNYGIKKNVFDIFSK